MKIYLLTCASTSPILARQYCGRTPAPRTKLRWTSTDVGAAQMSFRQNQEQHASWARNQAKNSPRSRQMTQNRLRRFFFRQEHANRETERY